MSGALYPAPILHNGILNATFNSSDFSGTTKSGNTINGPFVVNGYSTFNSGVAVNGTHTINGTETISGLTSCNGGLTLGTSSNLTLPSGKVITSANDLVDTTNAQNIAGVKQFTSNLGCNGTITTNGINTGGGGVNAGGGVIITSNFITANGGIQLQTPTALTSAASPAINCGSKSFGHFTLTLANNITGFSFTNVRGGGYYIIYITGGASIFTISNALTGGTFKTNFGGSPVSIPIGGYAILNCYYDGTIMWVNYVSYA